MQITANDIAFNCEIDGPEGAPWLTFSNSLATNLHMWDEQAEALKGSFRILRYDKRGHGKTEAVKGPYTFGMLIGDVVALWDELGIEKSHFVGLSIGGMTAQGLALEHRDRLNKVVISNSRADSPQAFRDGWDERIAIAESKGMGEMVDLTIQRWSSSSFAERRPEAVAKLKEIVATTSVDGYVGCARALQTLNFAPRLSEIDLPVLFIAGKDDMGTPAENMRNMHAQVGGSQFVELEPAGHISNMEQPEQYNETLRNYLGAN